MDPETDYGFGYQAYTDASSYAPVPPAPKPVPAAAPWPTYMVNSSWVSINDSLGMITPSQWLQ